jgi:hypothetical protein
MPLGEIKPLPLTATELFRLDRLSVLVYPGNFNLLRHLSRKDFLSWIYMQEPRTALILASDPVFRETMARQGGKRWYHEVVDYVWRKFHGTW